MEGFQRWEIIYDRINGALVSGVCGEISDETSEKGTLSLLIEKAYAARDRLSERLGIDPGTDSDFEELVSGFEGLSRTCAKLMYHYGYQDGLRMMEKDNQALPGPAGEGIFAYCGLTV